MVLGAQLYTLRDYIRDERDIRFTLAQVAKMGYTTVQVSGMGPIDPQVLPAADPVVQSSFPVSALSSSRHGEGKSGSTQ